MRLTDWRQRLMGPDGPVELARTQPYAWGVNDCGQFAGRCVDAVTGSNPIAELVGSYSDEAGAMALLNDRGASDMEAAVATLFPRIETGEVQSGDLGIVERRGKKILVVCLGVICAAPGARGLMFHMRSELTAAFRVS